MLNQTHIDVTIDFTGWKGGGTYDLRIPVHLSVKQLMINLVETLKLEMPKETLSAIKVMTKSLLLSDDDRLSDYPVGNGDILFILNPNHPSVFH
ncbi:EsaB/YukD family protein [Camelliibacillus cellulosilyticus]|uniref:EsaB/YukD family protein n=1 Tax=Camelliibacillus cellulosilyticus TaxID=2174486 RepID=A0ABV9GRY6_9BACL